MLRRVPTGMSSEWIGTTLWQSPQRTMRWEPLWRNSSQPCCRRIRRSSRVLIVVSLPARRQCAYSVDVSGKREMVRASSSTRRTHLRSVFLVIPNVPAIDSIAAHSEG